MIVYKVSVKSESGTKHHWFAKKGESRRKFRELTKAHKDDDVEVLEPEQCEIKGGRPGLVAFLSSLDKDVAPSKPRAGKMGKMGKMLGAESEEDDDASDAPTEPKAKYRPTEDDEVRSHPAPKKATKKKATKKKATKKK